MENVTRHERAFYIDQLTARKRRPSEETDKDYEKEKALHENKNATRMPRASRKGFYYGG